VKPYYEQDGMVIYHGNSAEILSSLDIKADLLLTDPPYGIGSWSSTGGNSITAEEAEMINKWDVLPNDQHLLAMVEKAHYSIVWGGNYFAKELGSWRTPLIWDKAIRGMHFADGELAWTNFDFGSLRIFNLPASASDARGNRQHPTQKPVQLMRWCIGLVKNVELVLDPFMGSGTTLRAAKDMGIKAIGIEIEEKYCEIAANRLAQGSLFAETD
jgi:DNA modification methylase